MEFDGIRCQQQAFILIFFSLANDHNAAQCVAADVNGFRAVRQIGHGRRFVYSSLKSIILLRKLWVCRYHFIISVYSVLHTLLLELVASWRAGELEICKCNCKYAVRHVEVCVCVRVCADIHAQGQNSEYAPYIYIMLISTRRPVNPHKYITLTDDRKQLIQPQRKANHTT